MKGLRTTFPLLLLIFLIAGVLSPAAADRLVCYDRATGQTVGFSAPYASLGGVTVSNGSQIAYWGSSGVYVINPGSSVAAQISSTAYTSGANFDMSSGYLIYGNNLRNLSTGSTSTCPAGSKLVGNMLAYKDGAVCKIVDAANGSLINQVVPVDQYLVDFTLVDANSSSLVFEWTGARLFLDTTNNFQQIDALTGAVVTGFAHYPKATPYLGIASETYFAMSTYDSSLGSYHIYSRRLGTTDNVWNGGGIYIDPRFALSGGTTAYISTYYDFNPGSHISLYDLPTMTGQTIYSVPLGVSLYGVQIDDRYATWFDTSVPEPSSLLALTGLIGTAGVLARKRTR